MSFIESMYYDNLRRQFENHVESCDICKKVGEQFKKTRLVPNDIVFCPIGQDLIDQGVNASLFAEIVLGVAFE